MGVSKPVISLSSESDLGYQILFESILADDMAAYLISTQVNYTPNNENKMARRNPGVED